jgi:hypothetical protein
MRALGIALGFAAVAAFAFAATGAFALGSEILDPAIDAIEQHMPADAQDTSGVGDVLGEVGQRLDDVLPDDVELPEQADDPLADAP